MLELSQNFFLPIGAQLCFITLKSNYSVLVYSPCIAQQPLQLASARNFKQPLVSITNQSTKSTAWFTVFCQCLVFTSWNRHPNHDTCLKVISYLKEFSKITEEKRGNISLGSDTLAFFQWLRTSNKPQSQMLMIARCQHE